MTDKLHETFQDLLAGEPPMQLAVGDVLAAGRRRRTRRQRIKVGVTALAVAPLLAVGVGSAVTRDRPGPTTVAGAPATSGPAPADAGPGPASASGAADPSASAGRPSGAGSVPSAGGVVGLPDPGFERVPSGWAGFGDSTTLTVVGTARSGSHALAVTTTATEPVSSGATNRPVLVNTVAGTRYTASCWVRSTASIGALVQVQEYTQDWARAGDPATSTRVALTDPGRWYQVSVSYVARHSGNQLPLTVYSNSLRAGGAALLVDDCSITATPAG